MDRRMLAGVCRQCVEWLSFGKLNRFISSNADRFGTNAPRESTVSGVVTIDWSHPLIGSVIMDAYHVTPDLDSTWTRLE